MARPPELTDDVVKQVSSRIAMGLSNRDAIESVLLTERSFYHYMARGRAQQEAMDDDPFYEVPENEWLYLQFFQAVKTAIPKRKLALIGHVQKAAVGGNQTVSTTRTYKRLPVINDDGSETYENVLVEETVRTDTSGPTWQAAAWLLERIHPNEFGRRTRIDVHQWQHEVLELYEAGAISAAEIIDELGEEIAKELFESAGISPVGLIEAETSRVTETD